MTVHIGKGTRAIVTGASWGIGETFAQALAARGADVLLVARNEGRLQAVAADLREQFNVRVEVVTVDLADPDGPRQLCEAAAGLDFQPNLLVNNAAIQIDKPFGDEGSGPDGIKQELLVNFGAPLALISQFLPFMLDAEAGSIVNLSSGLALVPKRTAAVYCATKHAVRALSEGLRMEVKPYNIRTTVISPGAVDTELPSHITDKESAAGILKFYKGCAIPADSFARAVVYAMSQPDDVDINEILFRPTSQEL